MLGTIGKYIVKVADLAEAEGRMASRGFVRAAVVILLASSAIALGTTGILMFAATLYLAMSVVVSPAWAMVIATTFVLIAAVSVGRAAHSFYLRTTGSTDSQTLPETPDGP